MKSISAAKPQVKGLSLLVISKEVGHGSTLLIKMAAKSDFSCFSYLNRPSTSVDLYWGGPPLSNQDSRLWPVVEKVFYFAISKNNSQVMTPIASVNMAHIGVTTP